MFRLIIFIFGLLKNRVFEMSSERSDEYVDWRGRKADPRMHGGIRAASFACGN